MSPKSGITKYSGFEADKNSLPFSDKSVTLEFSSMTKYNCSSISDIFFSLIYSLSVS